LIRINLRVDAGVDLPRYFPPMPRLTGTRAFDIALAAALTAASVAEVIVEGLDPLWASVPVFAAGGVALVWRRSHPIAVAAVFVAGMVGLAAAGFSLHSPVTPFVVLFVITWSIGAYASRPASFFGLAMVLAGLFASMAIDQVRGTDSYGVSDYPWVGALVSMPWLVGLAFGTRTVRLAQAETRAASLEQERDAAIAEERARIARELHDVIAHSVSVMTVQAGAAEEMLKRDPAAAVEPVRAVQETGRQALVEMKRLVGMLRERDDELGLAPQPGVDALDELVANVREAGLAVELDIEGAPRRLPPGVDISAYRIVQEALTNALKHARAARATVRLRYGADDVAIEVFDDGVGANGNGGGGGHGLVGMRERVAVFGGEFDAGPRDEGGFAVRARLPVEAPS
jgi:signal transduction histidine kinase